MNTIYIKNIYYNYQRIFLESDYSENIGDEEEYIIQFLPNVQVYNGESGLPKVETTKGSYLILNKYSKYYDMNDFINDGNVYDSTIRYHVYSGVSDIGTLAKLVIDNTIQRKENITMACNNLCRYFSYVTSATITDSQLVLTLNNTPSVVNENYICFRFNCGVAIPSGATELPVYIAIDGTNYPVWNKYGNVMVGSELLTTTSGSYYCPRYTYHGYFGEQTSGEATTTHIIVHNIPRAYCKVYLQQC